MTALARPQTAPIPTRAARTGRASMAKWVLLLGSMAALGALTTDMYLPSLPEVATELGTGMSAVQFTITGTLIGGAVGQLVIGPLSDRYGRRAPVFAGLVLHIVASLLCLLAYSVVPLIALRMLQGVGNAAAGVVAIAVIRDRMTGSDASALLSRLMLVIGVAPLLAPTIGSALAHLWGWRSVFVALAVLGAGLFVIVWRFLPETLPAERRLRSTRGVMRSYRVLAADGRFMAYALLPGLTMAALFAYVAGSPFVLRDGYGLSSGEFAMLFAINGAGLVLGAQLNAALVRRFAPIRIIRIAMPFAVICALVLTATALTGAGGLLGLLLPLFFVLFFGSFIPPNASAIALGRHGERAGAAAAFIGALQAGIAGVIAPIVGVLGGNATAMAIVMLAAVAVSLGVIAFGARAYRRGGWEATVEPDTLQDRRA
ncbi:multidrug effflux MFS transporter [Pseudactinotalea sp. HY158]|uniref:multidrug effflux MFS transporter n=1 Tax=Pseudactinotalea sp. HY158 TaxID=2654547 RepID=UPI001E5E7BA8|nr:multidrug effflux MFS transporter [Pseudactinotalea sp. HY158]